MMTYTKQYIKEMITMYEPFTDEQAIKMLKEEELGALALNGMELSLASVNNLPHCCSVGVDQAIAYLRDTYLECIESIGFFEWINKGNEDGKPMIVSKSHFKTMFKEISDMNMSLQGMIDDIAMLYNQEWWIFGYESYDIYLATTTYREDYTKINLLEVHQTMSYFSALLDNFKGGIEDYHIKNFIELINKNTNYLLDNYKIEEMTPMELFELVDEKLGLGYC